MTVSFGTVSPGPTPGSGLTAGGGIDGAGTDMAATWQHVDRISRRERDLSQRDLQDKIADLARQYAGQEPQVEGLPLLVSRSTMPRAVLDRYQQSRPTVCCCGLFPEIDRVWATIDNTLFVWRIDNRDDVVEWNDEEEAICAVGLVKPAQGIFMEAMEYVIVLCTTVEIVLLGVCFTNNAEQLLLQPLPLYTIPSDNITMCCVASSQCGRVFLGGADGHLYGLVYNKGDSWQRRSRKVCYSAYWMRALLPFFLVGQSSPVTQIAIDDHRHILYTLSQNHTITVYDLGPDGKDTPHRVAAASSSHQSPWSGCVVSISCIDPRESRALHLVGVTDDGRRLYFSTSRYNGGFGPAMDVSMDSSSRGHVAPTVLRYVDQLPSLQEVADSVGARGSHAVVSSCYSSGVHVMARKAGDGNRTVRLLLASAVLTERGMRELVVASDPPLPGDAGCIRRMPNREQLAAELASEAGDDLAVQHFLPGERYVMISEAEVREIRRRRPVEVLALLLEGGSMEKLVTFWQMYGQKESCCMLWALASKPPVLQEPSVHVMRQAQEMLHHPELSGRAVWHVGADSPGAAGGIAPWGAGAGAPVPPGSRSGDLAGGIGAGLRGGSVGSRFDMGGVVGSGLLEPEWSGTHKGLCLYVARLLQPLWTVEAFKPASKTAGAPDYRTTAGPELLAAVEDNLRTLARCMKEYRKQVEARGLGAMAQGRGFDRRASSPDMQPAQVQRLENAHHMEDRRTLAVAALVDRAADAVTLLRVLQQHHISRLCAQAAPALRSRLAALTLQDLVKRDGEAAANQLVNLLMAEHIHAGDGLLDTLPPLLKSSCPSFFSEQHQVYYRGSSLLHQAETAPSPQERRRLAQEGVQLLKDAPLLYNLTALSLQLQNIQMYDGLVQVVVWAADARDPQRNAELPGSGGEAARQARQDSYSHALDALAQLMKPASEGDGPLGLLSASERSAAKEEMLKAAVRQEDHLFLRALYRMLIDNGTDTELLKHDMPHLESFLREVGGLPLSGPVSNTGQLPALSSVCVKHLKLLARLYVGRQQYQQAAAVLQLLALRQQGPFGSDAYSPLSDRIALLQEAVLQARSYGLPTLLQDLEYQRTLMGFQDRILAALEHKRQSAEASGPANDSSSLRADIQALHTNLQMDCSTLYNRYARPHELWAICLELMHLASYTDSPEMIAAHWDVLLKHACAEAGGSGSASTQQQLERACQAVSSLGQQFWPGDIFPAAHIALRLEQIAACVWPEPVAASAADSLPAPVSSIIHTLRDIMDTSFSAVQAVYEELAMSTDCGQALRERVWASLLQVCELHGQKLRSEEPLLVSGTSLSALRREVFMLADACDRYAQQGSVAGCSSAVQQHFRDLYNQFHHHLSH